jgi:hypothetical protein
MGQDGARRVCCEAGRAGGPGAAGGGPGSGAGGGPRPGAPLARHGRPGQPASSPSPQVPVFRPLITIFMKEEKANTVQITISNAARARSRSFSSSFHLKASMLLLYSTHCVTLRHITNCFCFNFSMFVQVSTIYSICRKTLAGGTSLGGLKQLGLEQNLPNPKFSKRADFISK